MSKLSMKRRWAGAKPCRYCGRKVIDTGRLGKWYQKDSKDALCATCYHKLEQGLL